MNFHTMPLDSHLSAFFSKFILGISCFGVIFMILYLLDLTFPLLLILITFSGFIVFIPIVIIQSILLTKKSRIIRSLLTDLEIDRRLKPILHDCSNCSKLQNQQLIQDLRQKIIENTELLSLLPICAKCHKIRDDHGYWNQLEDFLKENAHLNFSHGYCPECTEEVLKEISL